MPGTPRGVPGTGHIRGLALSADVCKTVPVTTTDDNATTDHDDDTPRDSRTMPPAFADCPDVSDMNARYKDLFATTDPANRAALMEDHRRAMACRTWGRRKGTG